MELLFPLLADALPPELLVAAVVLLLVLLPPLVLLLAGPEVAGLLTADDAGRELDPTAEDAPEDPEDEDDDEEEDDDDAEVPSPVVDVVHASPCASSTHARPAPGTRRARLRVPPQRRPRAPALRRCCRTRAPSRCRTA